MNRINRCQFYIFILLGLMQIVVLANDSLPLTLGHVLDSVRQHFPKIIAAQQEIEKADASLMQAKAQFDPTISSEINYIPHAYYESNNLKATLNYPLTVRGIEVFTGYQRGIGDYPEYYGYRETLSRGEVTAGIRWPWLKNSAIDEARANLMNARLATHMSQQAFRTYKLAIFQSAARAYWDWVNMGYRLKIKESLYHIANQRQVIIQACRAAPDALRPS